MRDATEKPPSGPPENTSCALSVCRGLLWGVAVAGTAFGPMSLQGQTPLTEPTISLDDGTGAPSGSTGSPFTG